ncbi:MAG: hypothetical protein M3N49_04820 [Candidatus Eremiobacteraeota bacterium]|nr:hypothetical protein [Candidatus Eremiobacteraeota bacterium]
MTGVHATTLAALMLLAMTGCTSSHQASAESATTAADGTATTAPADSTTSNGATEAKAGAGHVSLTGEYSLEKDFVVSGCQVGPPGDGLLSGYHMMSKDGETPIGLLSVALKDYDKDGPYVQPQTTREAGAGRAMNSGVMGPLTLMVMQDAAAPLAFGQVAGSKLTITVSNNGAAGNAEFTDLESQPSMADFDPKSGTMPKGKRVSGSVTWTCESVDRIDAKMNDAVNGTFKKLIPPR